MRIFGTIGTLLASAALLPSACAAGDDGDAASMVRVEADLLIKAGRFREAAAELSKAVALEPDNYVNVFRRGLAHKMASANGEAVRDLTAALQLDPSAVAAYVNRAEAYVIRGNCEGARADVEKVLSLGTADAAQMESTRRLQRNVETCAREARHAFDALQHDKFDAAMRHVTAALAVSPENQELLVAKARVELHHKEYHNVIADAGRALKLDSQNLDALDVRGMANFYIGEMDQAVVHFQQCLRSDPEFKPCKNDYRRVKKLRKRFDAAVAGVKASDGAKVLENVQEGLETAPEAEYYTSRLHLLACQAHEQLGNGEEALAACERSLAIDSESEEALRAKADALILLERYDEAAAVFDSMGDHQGSQRAKKMAKQAARKDYYKILEIGRKADAKAIKKAYKLMSLKHHPDKNPDDPEGAAKRFQDVAEAYEVLKDDDLRRRYDNGEDLQAQPNQDFHDFFNFGGGGGGGFGGGGGGTHFTFRFG